MSIICVYILYIYTRIYYIYIYREWGYRSTFSSNSALDGGSATRA